MHVSQFNGVFGFFLGLTSELSFHVLVSETFPSFLIPFYTSLSFSNERASTESLDIASFDVNSPRIICFCAGTICGKTHRGHDHDSSSSSL